MEYSIGASPAMPLKFMSPVSASYRSALATRASGFCGFVLVPHSKLFNFEFIPVLCLYRGLRCCFQWNTFDLCSCEPEMQNNEK